MSSFHKNIEKIKQLVIIAGGKGTRLGLTDIPKPMVKIKNKPILEHQINLAKKYGIEEVFILSGHMSDVIKKYFKDGQDFGIKIHHIIEPYPLGTAGCLKLAEPFLDEKFLLFYGDIVMDFDIKNFVKFNADYKDIIGSIVVHPNDHPYDSDLVEIDEQGLVRKFISKPHPSGRYYQNLVNAAVYLFSKKIFKYIENNKFQDFGKDILPEVVKQEERLAGYKSAEYIKDMGTADRFEKVKTDFESGKVASLNRQNKRPCIFLDRDGVINFNMDSSPNVEDFKLIPGVVEGVRKINQSGFLAIVATNQPMIAKGFLTFDELSKIHKKMETMLGEERAYLDGIYFCPHHPERGFAGEIEELKVECNCRKPKSGMLLQAQTDFNIDLARSWMVGDSERDIIAGQNAGCKTILITTGKNNYNADYCAENLKEAVDIILNEEGGTI